MAGRIKQIVASYIESQIKDPRLGMVTVTDVKLTGDLHDATVFYTVYGNDAERAESGDALEAAKVAVALARLEQGNLSNAKGVGEGVLDTGSIGGLVTGSISAATARCW